MKNEKSRNIEKQSKEDKRRENKMGEAMAYKSEVIGIRDLRKNLADVLNQVTSHYDVVTAEDKFRPGRKVSIISTDILKELMDCYTITGSVGWDESTHQFFAKVNEIEVDGIGDSQDDAIKMAMDNAETATENFFEMIDMYMKVSRYKKMYPFFLKIRLAKAFDVPLLDILGFK